MSSNLGRVWRTSSTIVPPADEVDYWTKPGELYTRADVLCGFPELLARYHVDCASLLEEVGISARALDNPHLLISWERHCRFAELASLRCGEPHLGLKHAQMRPFELPVPNCGPLVLMAQFCTTLQDWIETASRYRRFHTNGWVPHLLLDGQGHAIIRFLESPTFTMPRQVAEGFVGIMFLLAQYIAHRPDLRSDVVRFRHAEPEVTHPHQFLFGCQVEFDQPHNEIVFNAEYLKLPVGGSLHPFRKLMDAYMRRQMRQTVSKKAALSSTLLIAIPPLLGTELCTAARVADSLGMSEKKMQRLLHAEGQSFRMIIAHVRKDIAIRMLIDSNVSIEIISGMLGYGSNAAFTLAFDGWFGQSPSAFRKAARESEVANVS